ncbi:MAG TPA: DUF5683 domain-containing protein [Chitinophagaceae bacterium]|nr:DUF5683 domain-containing protein [Chitinophagaceae bacterium]
MTSAQVPDTVHHPSRFAFITSHPVPKRSCLFSACVPGLGQIYNHQYWKAGIIYAGSAVITGFIISNYREYRNYHSAYIARIDADPATTDSYPEYSTDDLDLLRKGYRQYLQYSILSAVGAYTLNILDAFISAHLKSFDMKSDISFQLNTLPTASHTAAIGVSLKIPLR